MTVLPSGDGGMLVAIATGMAVAVEREMNCGVQESTYWENERQ